MLGVGEVAELVFDLEFLGESGFEGDEFVFRHVLGGHWEEFGVEYLAMVSFRIYCCWRLSARCPLGGSGSGSCWS